MILRLALSVLFIPLALAACGGGKGWPQNVKDKVIDTCVREAKAGGAGLEEAKVRNYCSCYQQNMEITFPNANDLVKATPQTATAAAQKCIELMFK